MTPPVALPTARSRLSALLTAGTCLLILACGAQAARAAGLAPQRDHGRGAWFARTCSTAPPGRAGCMDDLVVDAAGHALAAAVPPPRALGPAELHAAYSLPTLAPAPETIAVVDAFDDPRIESDLAAYSAYYGLPACTSADGCFRKVDEVGGTAYPRRDAGWSVEIALDVEVVHAVCQNCRILLVEAAVPSMAALGASVNEAVALGADVVSISWGGRETALDPQFDEQYFHHPGVPITVSSGDNGYGVEYPAASPYVTAVGGTTLHLGAGGYAGEEVWPGSGSGCSLLEPKPAWQTDVYCAHRTVADVAADADPNTGAAVYDSVRYKGRSGWFRIGGTSLSSPIVAGVYGLTGTTRESTYGSTPYARTDRLHDVVAGANGFCSPVDALCVGGAGFDGPTGLGTPAGVDAFSPATPPLPDFSLSATGSSDTAVPGKEASYAVTLSPAAGFAHAVGLTVTGLPRGATAAFSPQAVGVDRPSTTLTVRTARTTRPGTYVLTVRGTDASNAALQRVTRVTLAVQRVSPIPTARTG